MGVKMTTDRINNSDHKQIFYNMADGKDNKTEKKDGNGKEEQKKSGNSIFAGDLNLLHKDLEDKKNRMKQKALGVIMDAFSKEQKIDKTVDKHRGKAEEMKKEAANALGELNRISGLKENLKETYDIADDSQEQKDLELLEKYKGICSGTSEAVLTKEEQERLNNMGPLTEYQEAALDYHKIEQTWKGRVSDANKIIENEHRIIKGIQLERLKHHPIVDADKDSEKIIEAASKEFVGGLLEEAKDKIEEKLGNDTGSEEEIRPKDKKQTQEAQAAEEAEAKRKAKNKKNAKVPDVPDISEVPDWESIRRHLREITEKVNLTAEDLKGLVVDEQW